MLHSGTTPDCGGCNQATLQEAEQTLMTANSRHAGGHFQLRNLGNLATQDKRYSRTGI